ncbi:MAG: SMC-Scp complex subunit ScpB, partial [Gemmatimonadota bacterium]
EIRGVGSSGVLKTLQDRHLIDVVGRSEGLGRPLLYGTTTKFLDHFGFNSLEDLPRPEDLPVILRARPVESLSPSPSPAPAQADEPSSPSEVSG